MYELMGFLADNHTDPAGEDIPKGRAPGGGGDPVGSGGAVRRGSASASTREGPEGPGGGRPPQDPAGDLPEVANIPEAISGPRGEIPPPEVIPKAEGGLIREGPRAVPDTGRNYSY